MRLLPLHHPHLRALGLPPVTPPLPPTGPGDCPRHHRPRPRTHAPRRRQGHPGAGQPQAGGGDEDQPDGRAVLRRCGPARPAAGGGWGQAFLAAWKALPPETQQRLPTKVFNVETAKQRLQAANLFVLAHRPVRGAGGGSSGGLEGGRVVAGGQPVCARTPAGERSRGAAAKRGRVLASCLL